MKPEWIASTIVVLLGQLFVFPTASGQETTAMVRYHDENTGLTVLRANVSLPVPGYWFQNPDAAAEDSGLSEVFVSATQEAHTLLAGRRMSQREEQQEIDRGQWPLYQLGWKIRGFAEKHDGSAPKSIDEIGDGLEAEDRKQLANKYHVLDDLSIDPTLANEKTHLVAYETAPLVDDGKHWVLLSNGNAERRSIDPKLTPPVKSRRAAALEPGVKQADYTIHARLLNDTPTKIELKNSLTGQSTSVLIDPSKTTPGERDVLSQWALQRMASLPTNRDDVSATILPHWFRQAPALYGFEPGSLAANRDFFTQNRRGRTTGIFNVLGGRAAISETLQMEDIGTAQAPDKSGPETPINEIKGVEVKSHPFEEMLGNQEGGRIALAEVAPTDRLLAYFPKPAGLVSWLDGGAEFLFNAGSSATGRSLQYGLSDRYLAALGMDREWMRRLIDSGAVEEIAISAPDLFFIDGTELTVVARLKNPIIAAGLLQMLGITKLDAPTVRKGKHGELSHWARRGDLLFVSTDSGELDRALKLQATGGKESLGRSAEMRFMLTKLPLQESTRAFVYLSDPFIRRLVGPEVKIPQHRRIRARGEMEALVAGSLLSRLDGRENAPAADLIGKHYVSPPEVATDALLDAESGAISKTFGALPRMNSLIDLGITKATAQETAAYAQYLENYSRYWRRYFDPIALRLDQPDPSTYELSVFILPLIDNSIYNSLREIVASEGPPLMIPKIEPEPVATLSMNLREETWVKTGGEMLGEFARSVGLDTTILDYLGPDIHIAVADADPILEMGSGELTNAFGPMDNRDMPIISAIVSMFTRPTAVCVGLTDVAAVRRALDQSVGRQMDIGGSGISGSLYKVAGREGWVYRISFFDMITLRLGIEVQDRFLVVRNMPLTTPFRITGSKQATQPGAQISVSPRACRLQLPALFASAAERERAAAFGGISDLLPLLATGTGSIQEAAEKHKSWFGFRPIHPAGGEWNWDGRQMSSTRYGTVYQPTQPDCQTGSREFGMLRRVDGAEVGMRLEEDGLRTTARWQLRPVVK
ncbi:MAG: hypothetical protein ABIT37_24810 [Luteolibacter sp.]